MNQTIERFFSGSINEKINQSYRIFEFSKSESDSVIKEGRRKPILEADNHNFIGGIPEVPDSRKVPLVFSREK